jgi:outer membrane protein OmpA-like peptidoglycan-associated protein
MSTTLIDSFRSLLTPDTVKSIADRFGESESGISRGVEAGFGSILLGLINKANDPGAMRDLHGLISNNAIGDATTASIGDLLSGGPSGSVLGGLGDRLLRLAFGGNTASIGEAVSRSAGVRSSTANGLLSLIAPILLSLIAGRVRNEGLSPSGLGSLLLSQRDSIRGLAPADFSSVLSGAPAAAPRMSGITSEPRRRGGLGWAAVAALIALGLVWFLSRSRTPDMPTVATDTLAAPGPTMEPGDVSAYGTGTRTISLPNGSTLSVPATGLESQLVTFIQDDASRVSDTTWFNFDRLLFETGSATLKPESQEQLRNVAAILEAFPDVHVKIGGYTDNTGDSTANQRLSDSRAGSVMRELAAMGIEQDRMESEGYGSQHPVANNNTEEGRQQNRRIAIRVTEK